MQVDPGGDLHHRRHPSPAEGSGGFDGRITTGGNGQDAVAEDAGDHLAAHRQSPGDGHLSAVEDHRVGKAEAGAHRSERERRVENDKVSTDPVGRLADPADQLRGRDQDTVGHPFDADASFRLFPVERLGVPM